MLQRPLILEKAVDVDSRAKARAESSRSVVPAEAGTHGKYMQELRFLLTWIPAFAGMTILESVPVKIPDTARGAVPG